MRNALSIGEGRWTVFIERPMAATLLAIVVVVLVLPRVLKLRKEGVPPVAPADGTST
jgi:putative tricarboxylic transport membrane protein